MYKLLNKPIALIQNVNQFAFVFETGESFCLLLPASHKLVYCYFFGVHIECRKVEGCFCLDFIQQKAQFSNRVIGLTAKQGLNF